MDPAPAGTHSRDGAGGGGGVSLQEEKAALTGRLEELSQQEIRDSLALNREKKKTLEDVKTNFQTRSKELEKEIAEVERRRQQVEGQLDSFRKEKIKEIEDLTLEVGNLTRGILGKETGEKDQKRGRCRKKETGRPFPRLVSSSPFYATTDSEGGQSDEV